MSQTTDNLIPLPLNYFWNPTDPDLPYATSGYGNRFPFPPANATRTPVPSSYPKGTWPCWDWGTEQWVFKADMRQARLWDKETGQEIYSSTISIPEGSTDIEPGFKYSIWDEENQTWLRDTAKEQSVTIEDRATKKAEELGIAKDQIEQLGEIVDYLEESDEDYQHYVSMLKAWCAYRARVNLLKPEKLDTPFPARPETL